MISRPTSGAHTAVPVSPASLCATCQMIVKTTPMSQPRPALDIRGMTLRAAMLRFRSNKVSDGSARCVRGPRLNQQITLRLFPVSVLNGKDDDFDWTLHSGPSGSRYTGPQRDHTLGTELGRYMFTDASALPSTGRFPGAKGWLILSRVIKASASQNCKMRMWYYMYGNDVETLSVYRMQYSTGNPLQSGTISHSPTIHVV